MQIKMKGRRFHALSHHHLCARNPFRARWPHDKAFRGHQSPPCPASKRHPPLSSTKHPRPTLPQRFHTRTTALRSQRPKGGEQKGRRGAKGGEEAPRVFGISNAPLC